MKKLFLILALASSVLVANAQNKNAAAVKSAYEAAQKAADDAKKNTKAPTWIKLAQTCVDAYSAAAGNAWLGAAKTDLQLVMGNDRATSVENVEINGQSFTKETYSGKNFYFNQAGKLAAMEITKPILDGALDKALAAIKKAAALDDKAQKAKEILTVVNSIQSKFTEEAYNSYTLGNYAAASNFFEKAAEASAVSAGQPDAECIYNAGFTSWLASDFKRAKPFFEQALAAGYDGDNGETYAKLADIAKNLGDEAAQTDYLEKGFTKYPQSQSILVGLINYYVGKGGNTSRIFELLDIAKKNEPKNGSLYYVEGTIHEKLGDKEAALKAYDQCSEIDPNYEYGYIGKGVLLCGEADALLEAANADNTLTQAQYDAQIEKYYKLLKDSIDPFEKAFNICKDASTKASIASYLKNICFRFREESADYMAKYEMYSKAAAEE